MNESHGPPTRVVAEPDGRVVVELAAPIDLAATLWPVAHGRGDPTIRIGPDGVWRATRTPLGSTTMRLVPSATSITVTAWGDGAPWVIAHARDLCGANDRPEELVPGHRVIAELVHRMPGLRLAATLRPFDALLPAICEQKVTGHEARIAFHGIVAAYGEAAPGPARLRLLPEPATLARLPYFAFHRFGLERRRSEVIRRAAEIAPRLEGRTSAEVGAMLLRVPGIGPWTAAEVTRMAFGDPDAISVGDYHIPNLVAWALAGEPRADDARMLELLEPYRGQRGRIQRLLESSGLGPPRRGPRMAPRNITDQ
ncbi:MAG TPA: DNA-3-methyladenine glycosylase 2 family protein [Candidatus Limnocylindria bacterium]|nr:DNA-3-methyladenine glycosylase 2 family protein [Candidatus Limnocylindria bacterium]